MRFSSQVVPLSKEEGRGGRGGKSSAVAVSSTLESESSLSEPSRFDAFSVGLRPGLVETFLRFVGRSLDSKSALSSWVSDVACALSYWDWIREYKPFCERKSCDTCVSHLRWGVAIEDGCVHIPECPSLY